MPEPAQKYELFSLRACRKVDICWDGLQFLCISLCRRLLKSISYPFSKHAERLILGETVFNFYALPYAGDCSKVWDPSSEHAERLILAEMVFTFFLCISLCRRLLKSMSYPFSEHAERLTLAETVFDFYALAYAGVCSKVWVILSQKMQKG